MKFPANGEPGRARLGLIEAIKAASWMATEYHYDLDSLMPEPEKEFHPTNEIPGKQNDEL